MFHKYNKIAKNLITYSAQRFISNHTSIKFSDPFCGLNYDYFCNTNNVEEIAANIAARKGVGDIKLVLDLKKKLECKSIKDPQYNKIFEDLVNELRKIPNKTHPDIKHLKTEKIVKYIGTKRQFDYEPKEFYEISKRLNLVRTNQLGNVCGNRSYFILGEMAELEKALISYTVDVLLKKGFSLISVPDILNRDIIESCGLNTKGKRTQVYCLDSKFHGFDLCLSGTSEMALAGYLKNKILKETQLPLKLASVSRCFRAEVSSVAEERGIYRVHQFTKVEMFVVSTPKQSDELLEEICSIEEDHFSSLGLHLRTLDMPPHELGAPAYRKYDVESWLPGRNMYGEISSCSNCTDFQSRRLNIKYRDTDGNERFAHTLNGTACAVPRMLIALTETFQNSKGFIEIPEALQMYMRDKKTIGRQKAVPELKLIKHKK